MEEGILELYSSGGSMELSIGQVIKILPDPQVIRMPGTPPGIAGLVFVENRLIAARYLEGASPKDTYGCVVLAAGADGEPYGLLTDEITGGGQGDTFYR